MPLKILGLQFTSSCKRFACSIVLEKEILPKQNTTLSN